MKVSLIIFTLNEIDGMRVIMPQIKKEWFDELIIVDGGSHDGTIEYAKENGYFIFIQQDKGAGAAFHEAMAKTTGDIIVMFSPDGNSIPDKIPELVAKIKEGNDIVIASRYCGNAKSDDDDIVTAFGNKVFTSLVNFLFGSLLSDVLVMFRAYRKEAIDKLNIDTKTVAWGTEILIEAIRNNLKIAEIPADEPIRIGGVRKMKPLKNGVYELLMIMRKFFKPQVLV